MTLEQADKIADIILSAPKVFDSLPMQFPNASGITSESAAYGEGNIDNSAWLKGLTYISQIGQLSGNGVYACKNGFQIGYERPIKDGDVTQLSVLHMPDGRYATLDDIKMMAYVGIENYRAKAMGHRWRFNEKGVNTVNDTYAYHRGSIVRQEDGKRWIKCREGNVTPIPGVTIDGWVGRKGGTHSSVDPLLWSAFTRRPAYRKPTAVNIPLLDGVSFPFEKVTRFVKAATIEGHNDLVQLRDVWDYADMTGKTSEAIYTNGNRILNYEGRLVVRISEVDELEKEATQEEIEANSMVWVTSQAIPIDVDYYISTADNRIDEHQSLTPTYASSYSTYVHKGSVTRWTRVFRSNFIPLAEGRTYYVYIEREDSRASTYNGMERTCSMDRTSNGRTGFDNLQSTG